MTEKGIAQRPQAAAAADAFGVDLYRQLAAAGQDLVFSPSSVAAALELALLGARGSTADQLVAALHLDGGGDPATAAEDGLRLLSGVVQSAGGAAPADGGAGDPASRPGRPTPADSGTPATFRAPNSLWLQAGLPLEAAYRDQVRDAGAAIVRETDFRGAPQQARAEINDLIADQTAGKITNLLGADAVTADTRLVLANAVYLKARWAFPFAASDTRDAPFHPADGDPIRVPTMHRTASLPYLRGDGYQAVLLPYKDQPGSTALAMAIVLPDGPLTELAPPGLDPLLAAERQSVALALPKFRQRTRAPLIPVLRQLGVRDAFTDAADFTGITRAERLLINEVVHQAYIDVDEQGTEAAAATAIGMRAMAIRRGPDPIPFTVDRPFLFAITDTSTGLPLFLGQVARPSTG
ncbi:MAG: serpin family protein [Actinobacteria bacterium]|nr:serpin family protein [Actinomycetota bacterium]